MDYAQRQRSPGKHLIGLALVAIFHAVLIYALVNGLARKIVEVIKKPIETKIVEEHKPPPPPDTPPPPPPKMEVPPPPFIPPPEVQIAVAAPVTNTISQVTSKKPAPAPIVKTPPAPAVAPSPAKLNRDTCASERPPYPAASRRNEETGVVTLRISYDASGNVTGVDLAKSSGHSRLDESAKSWVPTCKLYPGTVNGHAVAGSVMLPFSFTLEN